MVSKTVKKNKVKTGTSGNSRLTAEELVFRDIQQTFRIPKNHGLGNVLSVYLAMAGLRQGCYLVAPKTVAKQSIIEFFRRNNTQYPVNYRIWEHKSKSFAGSHRVFISTHTVPANLIGKGDELNHTAIGRFLGYPCPRNLFNPVDDKKKTKLFSINLRLANQTKSRTQKSRKTKNNGFDQIFGFVCLADDNNNNIRDTREKTQEFCNKITVHCRPRFPNLLPGLTVYLHIRMF